MLPSGTWVRIPPAPPPSTRLWCSFCLPNPPQKAVIFAQTIAGGLTTHLRHHFRFYAVNMSYSIVVKYLSCFTQLNIWRRIEEAVTRLTRNQFVRKGTRVRIPPSPFPARGLFTSIAKYIRFQSKVYPKFFGDLRRWM